jgi:hypothetical protein
MAVEEMATVYMAMDDEPVRQQVLRREWEQVGGAGLTAEERAMLLAAAEQELPDVSGYGFGTPMVVNAQSHFDVINHIGLNLTAPASQGSFLAWQQQRGYEFSYI